MRTSNYIFYLVVIISFGAGMISCKKNSTPTSYATNKAALQATIDSLTTVYNKAVEGSKPGDYAIGAKEALNTALSLAGQVASAQTYTQQQVNNALNNLLKAGAQFSTQLLQEVSVANLVAFWKFNGNALDSSGNGHNGTPVTGYIGNSAATATDGGTLPQWVPDRFGRPNMAYDFNNGATVEVPYSSALNAQSFTICLWLKRHTTNANNYMFSLDRWNGFKFQLQSNNFPFLTINTTTGYHDQDDNPGTIDSVDVWRHVAVSYTNGTMKFYIQGELTKTANVTGVPLTLKTPVNLAIGNELPKDAYNLTNSSDPNYFYGGDFFIGSLDDIRFYNTALTDAEVLSIYKDESTLN
ncbi:MAG TPA: LamG domain-containing protein [Puia sp.]